MHQNNIISEKQISELQSLINFTRTEYNAKYRLSDCFADHCDAVSVLLLESMESNGFTGANLVSGFYEHAYPDADRDQYGHVWIEWGDYIIDATRCQFDTLEFIFLPSEKESNPYH